ncbi:cytochrome b-c1 complex subunit 8 [Ptiloglossa arizonensis]|uniref:cytochrome b-c1 complex subunit 8 n=1 Tax=Ptiloglossa arizonensis TaxID=3350558 RepID=UPI003FA06694
MGLKFGELPVRIRKVVYYTLCSMEQRVWAKSVSHSIPNLFYRAMHALPPIMPGLLTTVCIIKWGIAENKRSKRKDPKLYENDT